VRIDDGIELPAPGSDAFFRAIVETAASPYAVIDEGLVLRYVSPSITNLLGWLPAEWIGRSIAELLVPESLEVASVGLRDLQSAPEDPDWVGAPVRVFLKHADGGSVPVDALARDSSRTGVGGVVVQLIRAGGNQAMSDAVDAILDGNDLERALTLLTSLIEHDITNTIAVLASDWDGTGFGQVAGNCEILRFNSPRPLDRDAIRHALLGGHEVTSIFDALEPTTQRAAIAAGMHTCWCAPVTVTAHDLPHAALFIWHVEPGAPGAIYRTDISRSVNLARLALRWMGHQRVLAWDASHDRLTGLTNRTEFQNRLDAGVGRPRAVLYCDLDDFKPVNDRFGHRVGDQVLAAVAGRMRNAAGDAVIARLGGDEFAVLLDPVVDPHAPLRLAEAIRSALTTSISALGQLATVGVSIGVAVDLTGEAGSDHLLDEADRLLREGKAHGKNQVRSVTLPL
jgi:diguanylate cyclase (GGDEF)-like protein/PAS domain S-box-containing protein